MFYRHSAEILSPTETTQDCLTPEQTLQSQVSYLTVETRSSESLRIGTYEDKDKEK
jgi:hypothetical protein